MISMAFRLVEDAHAQDLTHRQVLHCLATSVIFEFHVYVNGAPSSYRKGGRRKKRQKPSNRVIFYPGYYY